MLVGLIKQWEKNMSRTMYKDVSIRQPTQDSTNLKLLEDEQENQQTRSHGKEEQAVEAIDDVAL